MAAKEASESERPGWWVQSKVPHLRAEEGIALSSQEVGDHALWTWGGWPSLVLV